MGICCPDPLRTRQVDAPSADFADVKLRRQNWDSLRARAGLLQEHMATLTTDNNRCGEECGQFARRADVLSKRRPHSSRRRR